MIELFKVGDTVRVVFDSDTKGDPDTRQPGDVGFVEEVSRVTDSDGAGQVVEVRFMDGRTQLFYNQPLHADKLELVGRAGQVRGG